MVVLSLCLTQLMQLLFFRTAILEYEKNNKNKTGVVVDNVLSALENFDWENGIDLEDHGDSVTNIKKDVRNKG